MIDSKCKGRALFTFGGGYSITAVFRIWTILYLLLFKLDIPERLPKEWRIKWQKKTGKNIPESLHDILPAFDSIPRKKEIEKHNKETAIRLLDAVTADWI